MSTKDQLKNAYDNLRLAGASDVENENILFRGSQEGLDTNPTDTVVTDATGGSRPRLPGGGGINYTPYINAAIEGMKRSAPTYKNQYQTAINNLFADKDKANDLYNDNIDLAYDTYNANMQAQRRLNEDDWYSFRQRLQNWKMLNNTELGPMGQRGSLNQTVTGLTNLTNDQHDQTLLANLRAGQMSYYQSLMDSVNQNRNAQRLNEMDVASQANNLKLQYQSDISNMINQTFANLAGYNAKNYIGSDGKITSGGWDLINQLGLGATNDGNGGISVDTSVLSPEGADLDSMIAALGNKDNAPFLSADYLKTRRKLSETNRVLADRQATTDRVKSSKTLTTPEIWSNLERRYG